MASISLRQSIAWLPAAHSENTSTVVLTSPQRRFVDVRILLPTGGHPSMVDGSLHVPPGEAPPALELEWALAGTSSSSPAAEDSETTSSASTASQATTHAVWRHWVDSRYEDADSQVDEGTNVEQADGSVLETGAMLNPATGRVGVYEEVWRDIAPLQTLEGDDDGRPPRCVVLQMHDESKTTTTSTTNDRGVVEVLGQFCQGIARTARDGVTVERWQWRTATSQKGDSPAWQRVFRCGSGSLPCKEAIESAEKLKEGETVTCGRGIWTVVEAADL